ncbi:1-phosphofructokinase [Pseudomonas sp. CCI3.2]|uniref:1-phosphofructokinase n=1 Tax=unclassified Pseudomonas TaxID=196821 RepID=UPI002AC91396|nr:MULTISPECIES: 1-phosphofructokinase [unclassified Pseudomonas]MEB0079457.1 1-phosphofructokinase [Pseudomonas sp. MH10out]MEB0090944.1 1-phosphofructokinase [Pseudomonas sp. CCI4.2]MEB0102617.1 1-phosphofructokinase [Pseudomonas sp. CCI3.2]MEB0122043.1 1-phosphofructokinase [Pseudomonas sp. CCI1.2]MEB0132978.1 1-phosphofructokinase [Pseudomonas sp. CCI2.4]
MAKILTLTLNPALDLTVQMGPLQVGQVNRSHAMFTHAAGKGLNVAQVLADLGHELTVGGFLGIDNQQPFETLFAHRRFVDEFVRVPGETRSNIKLAESSGRITDLNGPGPQVGEDLQHELMTRLEQIAGGFDAVVVAGSLPRGVSPQWLQALLLRLNAMGLKVALDTSGMALRAALSASPWLIKPNTEELAEALDAPIISIEAQAEVAARLRGQGIEHVVISQGSQGVHWFSSVVALQALPPQVTVASTVGAGDSLLAGMVHGLISGHSPQQTLRTATAIAAMAVTQIGFGISDLAQLKLLEKGVNVRALTEQ